MLTLEMIRDIKKEDREFWMNKCTAKELKKIIVSWRDIKIKRSLGYTSKITNKEYYIGFIKKILEYEEQERVNEYFENIKKESEPKVAEQLTKGDNITDLELKGFYYRLIKNYYEKDLNLREMNDPWRKVFREDEERARRYYKGLMRYFHSDTSEYADTEMFNIVKDTYKYNKEEYEYYKNLDVDLDENVDFSDIEINVNMRRSSDNWCYEEDELSEEEEEELRKRAMDDLKRWKYI